MTNRTKYDYIPYLHFNESSVNGAEVRSAEVSLSEGICTFRTPLRLPLTDFVICV